jgi:hypothetical protein
MKTLNDQIQKDVEQSGIITEKQILLLLHRMNAGEKIDVSYIWDNHPNLTNEQSAKGLNWLKNLWKSPTGKERKNNPFGYREEKILETETQMYLVGFYDTARYNQNSYFVPLYGIGGMEYYLSGGQISIIG